MLKKLSFLLLLFVFLNCISQNEYIAHCRLFNLLKYSTAEPNTNFDSLLTNHLNSFINKKRGITELNTDLIIRLKKCNEQGGHPSSKILKEFSQLKSVTVNNKEVPDSLLRCSFFNVRYVGNDEHQQLLIKENPIADTNHNIVHLRILYRVYGIVNYFSEFDKTNFYKVFEKNLQRAFTSVLSEHEFTLVLSETLTSLGDGHAIVFTKEKYDFTGGDYEIPIEIKKRGDHYVIANKKNELNDLNTGDTLLSINGIEINERLRILRNFLPANSQKAAEKKSIEFLTSTKLRINKIVRLNKGLHEEKEITAIPKSKITEQQKEFEIIDKQIAYLCPSKNIKTKILTAFSQKIKSDPEIQSVIIDLRKYPTEEIEYLFRLFAHDTSYKGMLWSRQSISNPDSLAYKLMKADYTKIKSLGLKKKMYLLVNHNTFSRGEIVALVLKKAFNATVIGQNSIGSIGSMTMINLDKGNYFSLTLERFRCEKTENYFSVPLDYDLNDVDLTSSDLLIKAIEFVKRGIKKP